MRRTAPILFLAVIIFTLIAGMASGETIYVDASASPGGDGSLLQPYQTITEGLADTSDSSWDNVIVKPGDYNENFTITNSFTKLRKDTGETGNVNIIGEGVRSVIEIHDVENVHVLGVSISSSDFAGIWVNWSTDVLIEEVAISSVDTGIVLEDNPGLGDQWQRVENITINDVTLLNIDGGKKKDYEKNSGIWGDDVRSFTFQDVSISETEKYGIFLEDSGTLVTPDRIIDCTLEGTSTTGIRLDDCTGVKITGTSFDKGQSKPNIGVLVFESDNISLESIDIWDLGFNGLKFQESWDIEARNVTINLIDVGVYTSICSEVWFENLDITRFKQGGAQFEDGKNITLRNSSITLPTNSKTIENYVESARVRYENCVFNGSSVQIARFFTETRLTVANYLKVHVEDTKGGAVKNAEVRVTDNNNTADPVYASKGDRFNGDDLQTNTNGNVFGIMVTDRIYWDLGKVRDNWTDVEGKKGTWYYTEENVDMSESKTVTLMKNSPPELYPESLTEQTSSDIVKFRVFYVDLDDDAPTSVKIHLDGDKDGVEMDESGSNNDNYLDGQWYEHYAQLTRGNHSYSFSAKDLVATNQTEDMYLDVQNSPPVLTNLTLSFAQLPYFNFSIEYYDQDGDWPVNLTVNGTTNMTFYIWSPGENKSAGQQMMHHNGTPRKGAIFFLKIPLENDYYLWEVKAFDAFDTVTEPQNVETQQIFFERPSIGNPKVDPPEGWWKTSFRFSAKYTHENIQAKWIHLTLTNPNNVTTLYNMTDDHDSGNIKEGITYWQDLKGFRRGTYWYNISAYDGTFIVSTVPRAHTVYDTAPQLNWTITPRERREGGTVTIFATYTDVDEEPIDGNITVQIFYTEDGRKITNRTKMLEVDPADTQYSDGKLYRLSIPGLPKGNHTMKFNFSNEGTPWTDFQGPMLIDVIPTITVTDDALLIADIEDSIEFNAVYQDKDGDPIQKLDELDPYPYLRIWIRKMKNSDPTVVHKTFGPYRMTVEDDVDWNDTQVGVPFYYKRTFNSAKFPEMGAGYYTYYVTGSDGYYTARSDLAGADVTIAVVNQGPNITDLKVNPPAGYDTTTFNFQVRYKDREGSAPSSVWVVIGKNHKTIELTQANPSNTDYANETIWSKAVLGSAIGLRENWLVTFFASDGNLTSEKVYGTISITKEDPGGGGGGGGDEDEGGFLANNLFLILLLIIIISVVGGVAGGRVARKKAKAAAAKKKKEDAEAKKKEEEAKKKKAKADGDISWDLGDDDDLGDLGDLDDLDLDFEAEDIDWE